jgi:hypothetical protein
MQLAQVDDTAQKLRQLAAVSLAKQREAQASCKGNAGCEKVLQQVSYPLPFVAVGSQMQHLNGRAAGAQPFHAASGRGGDCLTRSVGVAVHLAQQGLLSCGSRAPLALVQQCCKGELGAAPRGGGQMECIGLPLCWLAARFIR